MIRKIFLKKVMNMYNYPSSLMLKRIRIKIIFFLYPITHLSSMVKIIPLVLIVTL